ncbi:MAG: YaaA family protein, partial [Erysipelothrix sp.]|nr:YaaA family protein [Erysipelothrix sp.]
MIVLLSPTKTMKQMPYKGAVSEPAFMDHTAKIVEQFKSFDAKQLQSWYGVSDKIAQEAFLNWQRFDSLQKTIALYAYQGEAFRNLDARSLTNNEIMKVNKHLRILSALYGILLPLNEIRPYRLDLTKSFMSLGSGVKFWQEIITEGIIEEMK